VLVYTPRLAAAGTVPGEVGAQVEVAASLDELLAAADYVSLHVPATAQSAGLIGEHELGQMKPTAYLINTSRGALIDEDALTRALAGRSIAGAALDVLSREPPPDNLPLLGAPNLILTPHAAFYSDASIHEVQTRAAGNVAAVLSGEVPEHVVNPDVLEADTLRMRASDLAS
jgi:phosphoglycerate dehydrogenase-like enzyme